MVPPISHFIGGSESVKILGVPGIMIDSGSSRPEFISEYTGPSLRGEVYSNMNSGVLELELDEVHFAEKFSGDELARQRRRRRVVLGLPPS